VTTTEHDLLEQLSEAELPPQVKALGVTRRNGQPALLVVTAAREGLAAFATAELLPRSLHRLPVVLRDVPGKLHAAAYLPSAQREALTPEQEELDPVVLGAQVQNGAADERQGGYGVGALGAFARDADGNALLLSNNHVIAAENDAVIGDVIYQAQRGRGRAVATLAAWVPVSLSTPNRVDIASATLNADTASQSAFLPLRNRPEPAGVAAPRVGAKVFKVGRWCALPLAR
jgi:hypothetical protein